MHPLVKAFEKKQIESLQEQMCKTTFKVGDTIRIKNTIEEGSKKWTQTSEGVCIAKFNKGICSSFKIKRVDKETIMVIQFPIYMKGMQIEVLKRGKVRRAKLNYLIYRSKKKSQIKSMLPEKKAGK